MKPNKRKMSRRRLHDKDTTQVSNMGSTKVHEIRPRSQSSESFNYQMTNLNAFRNLSNSVRSMVSQLDCTGLAGEPKNILLRNEDFYFTHKSDSFESFFDMGTTPLPGFKGDGFGTMFATGDTALTTDHDMKKYKQNKRSSI